MKSTKFIFPAFLLITLITFYPTIGAGFVFDFLGWQRVYDQGSFGDILHSFGYKGNHQALHFFFYSLYSLFHIQGWPWYIIFCSLHAFNAWLVFIWLSEVCKRWQIQAPSLLILLTCLLILVHPYNVEPVVWKVCVHYLLSLTAVLSLLILVLKYLDHGSPKGLWACIGVFTTSLFLLELSYVTPLVITAYVFIHTYASSESTSTIRRTWALPAIMWGLLVLVLIINRITLGAWVGHYGAAAHLSIDVIGMMSTELKYLVSHLTDARYFSFKTKSLLFDTILSNPELTFFFLTSCIALALFYVIRIRRWKGYIHLAFFGVVASMLYVLTVSNLFFYHLMIGTNDRFSYLPLVFLLGSVMALLSATPRWMWISFTAIVLVAQVYLQEKTITLWKESTEVVQHLRDTFHWHDRSHVFILNSPDNLQGIVMTRIIKAPSGIDELIDFQTNKPYDGVIYDVFQYNMTTPDDGVTVEQTGPMQLKVTFKQWGNWWHLNGIGGSTYENEYYKAETLDYPYQITFKQFPPGSVILYQDGKDWKEFEMKMEE